VYAELRRMAAEAEPVMGDQLRVLADRLAHAGDARPACAPLTSRELDVLALVALGCTNSEAAQRLSLKTQTVKSYLRSAAAKLGTRTRHEAVTKARRSRLLP
jgi:LuxR family transcriptional regulator, regulator of acetate metabolism